MEKRKSYTRMSMLFMTAILLTDENLRKEKERQGDINNIWRK